MREPDMDPFEFATPLKAPATSSFVFEPAPLREELPPRTLSIARIVLTVLLVAGLIAGIAWALGSFLNGQLARLATG